VITRAQVVALVRQVFPSAILKKMAHHGRGRVSLDLCKAGRGDILLNLWDDPDTHEIIKPALVQLLRTMPTPPPDHPSTPRPKPLSPPLENWFGSSASAIWRQSCCCWPTPGTPNYGSRWIPPGSWGPGPR